MTHQFCMFIRGHPAEIPNLLSRRNADKTDWIDKVHTTLANQATVVLSRYDPGRVWCDNQRATISHVFRGNLTRRGLSTMSIMGEFLISDKIL